MDFAAYQTSVQDEVTGARHLIDGSRAVEAMTQSLAVLREWIHARLFTSGSRPGHFKVISDSNTVGILTDRPVLNHDYAQKVWVDLAREYTTLSLTVSSDTLAAIEGLAS